MAIGAERTFEGLPIKLVFEAAISVRSGEGRFLFGVSPGEHKNIDLMTVSFKPLEEADLEFSAAMDLNTHLIELGLMNAVFYKPSNRLATITIPSEGEGGRVWVDTTRVIYPADVTQEQVEVINRTTPNGADWRWFTLDELSEHKEKLRYPVLEEVSRYHTGRAYIMNLGFAPEQLWPLFIEPNEDDPKVLRYAALKEMERMASFT